MDVNLGLVLGIAVGLLVVAGVMAVGLTLVFSLLSPLPAKPPEAEEPSEPEDEEVVASRKAAYRQGILVLIGLAVLTAAEFAVATLLDGSVALLFILILAKAGVIIQYYMHLNRVWGEEAHS